MIPRVSAIDTVKTDPGEAAEGCCDVYFFDESRVSHIRESLLSEDLVQQVAAIFKVLAHSTRIRILRALAREELCVCDLAHVLGLSISATSHQLRMMREMKLVRYRMEGKRAYYSLRDRFIGNLLDDGVLHLTGEDASG